MQRHNRGPRAAKERSAPVSLAPYPHRLRYERGKRPDRRGLEPAAGTCHNDPPLPRAMTGRTLSKKMRAFDGEVAIAVSPFYSVHMLRDELASSYVEHGSS